MSFSFGSTSNNNSGGGFSFGTSAQPASSSGFTFGSSTPSATTTTQPAASTGGFTFGSPAATTQPAASTGGFTFGSSTTTQPAASTGGFTFGSSQPAASTGGFSFGSTQPQQTQQQQQQQQPQQQSIPQPYQQPLPSGAYLPQGLVQECVDPITQQINNLSHAIDPSHPKCRLQYVLYNLLPLDSPFRQRLSKPILANEELWQDGVRRNPKPELYVPCLIVGWEDLLIRLQQQDLALTTHFDTMKHLSTHVTAKLLADQKNIHLGVSLVENKQNLLNRRLLQIINRLELLRTQNLPVQPQEINYFRQLQQIQKTLLSPEVAAKIQSLTEYVSVQSSLVAANNAEAAERAKAGITDDPKAKLAQDKTSDGTSTSQSSLSSSSSSSNDDGSSSKSKKSSKKSSETSDLSSSTTSQSSINSTTGLNFGSNAGNSSSMPSLPFPFSSSSTSSTTTPNNNVSSSSTTKRSSNSSELQGSEDEEDASSGSDNDSDEDDEYDYTIYDDECENNDYDDNGVRVTLPKTEIMSTLLKEKEAEANQPQKNSATLNEILAMLTHQGQLINALAKEVSACNADVKCCNRVLDERL